METELAQLKRNLSRKNKRTGKTLQLIRKIFLLFHFILCMHLMLSNQFCHSCSLSLISSLSSHYRLPITSSCSILSNVILISISLFLTFYSSSRSTSFLSIKILILLSKLCSLEDFLYIFFGCWT